MNYKVYQGTELKQTVTSKIAVMNGLQPNRTYDFSVQPDNGQPGYDGTNLLINSSSSATNGQTVMPGSTAANVYGVYSRTDSYEQVSTPTSYNDLFYRFMSPDPNDLYGLTPGETYTLSGAASYTSGKLMFRSQYGANGVWIADDAVNLGIPVSDGSVFTPFSHTFTVPAGTTGVYFSLENYDYATDGLFRFKNMRLEKGSVATTSVTTRGIRFNIPKTLTVDSTITLRYEEYPLGIIPIGNEPPGYFGGGNKQNLSAKVISTANGSSVVEVAGNVIEVGGSNLLQGTSEDWVLGRSYFFVGYQVSGGLQPGTTYTLSGFAKVDQTAMDNKQRIFADAYTNDWSWSSGLFIDGSLTGNYNKVTFTTPIRTDFHPTIEVYLSHPNDDASKDSISGAGYISKLKLEKGDIATPYASFVDGDTFTAKPDGTYALFSEYKALYY